MPPGGKRGAKAGPKWTREPQLGDLVLARVKGYPPWPAKISRPEDWGRTPTPRKFFVYFYGTREIGFVTLADLQEFTEKAKNELLDRAPSIKIPKKYAQSFNEAVEQICKAYDDLPKSSEAANSALPDRSGKSSEHLVKSADDSETPGLGQMEVDSPIDNSDTESEANAVNPASASVDGHEASEAEAQSVPSGTSAQPGSGKKRKQSQVAAVLDDYLEHKKKQLEKTVEALLEKRTHEEEYSVEKCLDTIDAMEELTDEEKAIAAEVFEDDMNRQMFMKQKNLNVRLIWLQRKISRLASI